MNKLIIVFAFIGVSTFAQKPKVFSTEDGATNGYDPVAYFEDSKPAKGVKEFSYTWNDAVWYFSSTENLEAFKSDPGKYAPQYGGYCAFGTSRGYKASTLPEAWTVYNDKLYLNYNLKVLETWTKTKEEFIIKADKNWKEIEMK